MNELVVKSSAFRSGESIPSKYTCDGKNVNPPLKIENIPNEAVSLAIIMDDPDASNGIWTHWVVWDLPIVNEIEEASNLGIMGATSLGKSEYHGPCPPTGTHRYFFKVYALNEKLGLPPGTNRDILEPKIRAKVISAGHLMGIYSREKSELRNKTPQEANPGIN
jgi:Raf kinase inhibitor-like YbhB/YbcL family protein